MNLYLVEAEVDMNIRTLEVLNVAKLSITFNHDSDDICICVDQGDGQVILFQTKSKDTDCNLCPDANVLHKGNSTVMRVDVPIAYRHSGIYSLRVKISHNNALLISKVLKITVTDSSSSYNHNIYFVDRKLLDRSQPLQLSSRESYIIRCKVNSTKGSLLHIPTYDFQISTEDPSDTSDSQLITEVESVTRPNLLIKAWTLLPGMYRVTVLERQFEDDNTPIKIPLLVGYFRINLEPLVVRLLNTSMSRIVISKEEPHLCLQPEVYTAIESSKREVNSFET